MALIELLLLLPTVPGAILLMGFTTAVGVPIYVISYRLLAKSQPKEVRRATNGLFRVIGILVSLFLSLTFADVMLEQTRL